VERSSSTMRRSSLLLVTFRATARSFMRLAWSLVSALSACFISSLACLKLFFLLLFELLDLLADGEQVFRFLVIALIAMAAHAAALAERSLPR